MFLVGALLENESISGLSEGKPTGVRRTSNSMEMVWTPDDLIAVVSCTLHLLKYSSSVLHFFWQILASMLSARCLYSATPSLYIMLLKKWGCECVKNKYENSTNFTVSAHLVNCNKYHITNC